jgi:hypothetical protein
LKGIVVEDVRWVNEYPYVFAEELPSLPPNREIEFDIESVPGTAPVANRLYRLPANEIAKMKKQIHKLIEKGYIRPSTLHWVAPVC